MSGVLGDYGVFSRERRKDGLLECLDVVGFYVFSPSMRSALHLGH
jgi:hypothetical protein